MNKYLFDMYMETLSDELPPEVAAKRWPFPPDCAWTACIQIFFLACSRFVCFLLTALFSHFTDVPFRIRTFISCINNWHTTHIPDTDTKSRNTPFPWTEGTLKGGLTVRLRTSRLITSRSMALSLQTFRDTGHIWWRRARLWRLSDLVWCTSGSIL